jgi:multidrug resistance efflux pump
VLERGNLESSANVTVTCKVEGSTTIIKIVEEGTAVKKGDLLFELDSSSANRTKAISRRRSSSWNSRNSTSRNT